MNSCYSEALAGRPYLKARDIWDVHWLLQKGVEPLNPAELPEGALLLMDTAPIVYFLERHPRFGPVFKPLFEAHAAGRLRFAVTTITLAEVADALITHDRDFSRVRSLAVLP